jgi:RHS repeat-associated protein
VQHSYIFFAGRMIARTDHQQSWSAHFYFSDHLGSSNVVTNATGTLENEPDFYPYGGEIVITNSVPQSYKFTGKERDGESGLDNFGARYYASGMGRFMTPDWAARPTTVPYASFGDPQTLNLYTYVENAPVNKVDADGHAGPPTCSGHANWNTCNQQQKEEAKKENQQQNSTDEVKAAVMLLGNKVTITYAAGMSDKDRASASGRITAAVGLLNANAGKFSNAEKETLANIKTIDVDPSASRSSVTVQTGTLHENSGQLAEGTERLAADIAHDAFHITQFKGGSPYAGGPAEVGATNFEIGIGPKVGLSQGQINDLIRYRDDIEKHKGYWNSPVTHPSGATQPIH